MNLNDVFIVGHEIRDVAADDGEIEMNGITFFSNSYAIKWIVRLLEDDCEIIEIKTFQGDGNLIDEFQEQILEEIEIHAKENKNEMLNHFGGDES